MPDSGQIGKSIIAAAPVSAPNTTGRLLRRVLEFAIEGSEQLPGARIAAGHQLVRRGSAEDAIEGLIRNHAAMCGAQGFVTNLGGFVTLVVGAPTNLAGVALIQARMVAAIAHLRGYDLTDDRIRTAVLLTLVGSNSADVLAKAGVSVGTSAALNVAGKNLPKSALMVIQKAVGFRILRSVGERVFARVGKLAPLVGGLFGAGIDLAMMKRISEQARAEFPRTLGTV